MRTWTRARELTICGGCGRHIAKGAALLEVTFGPQRALKTPVEGAERPSTWRQTRPRCVDCAGELVPVDLPPLEVRQASIIEPTYKPKRAPLFASVGSMAIDWKAKQAAGREPGEEG